MTLKTHRRLKPAAAKICWLLVVWGVLAVRAQAQYPDIIPTMPALPVVVDATPPTLPDIQSAPLPPFGLQPREMPETWQYPREGREPPYHQDNIERPVRPGDRSRPLDWPAPSDRSFQPVDRPFAEKPYSSGERAPVDLHTTVPYAVPAVSPVPDSMPVRTRTGLGQFVFAVLHPFRKTCQVVEQPAGGHLSQAETAAAAIKAAEIYVERRRAAVRYLGGVDCAFNPEAESGLLAALRCDRYESVRYEAALALGNSCCWTKKTIDAMQLVTTGGTADGNPAERSDRVRWAASQALTRYAAAVKLSQPRELLSQQRGGDVRQTSGLVPPVRSAGSYYVSAPPGYVDPVTLPPLMPIGRIPDAEQQAPAYEPTPLQSRSALPQQ